MLRHTRLRLGCSHRPLRRIRTAWVAEGGGVDADDRPENVEFVQGDIRNKQAVKQAVHDAQVVHHNVAMVPLAKDRFCVLCCFMSSRA